MANIIENLFERYGYWVARNRIRMLWFMGLLALGGIYGTIYTLQHLDVNLFNQISDHLLRTKVLRELSEEFGGDILAAVISIPDEAAKDKERVAELRAFGDLLTKEMAKVGTLEEDRAAIPADLPLEGDIHKGPWMRQVECRAGHAVREALLKIAKSYPHAVLSLDDVKSMASRLEPEFMAKRMKEVRAELAQIDPIMQLEREVLISDPLGLGQVAADALKRRLASRGKGLAVNDAEGYFLSRDSTTLIVLARPIASASVMEFNRALMQACQRAENRAIEAFRKRDPAPLLTTALKGTAYGDLASGEDIKPTLRIGFTGLHPISVENEQSMFLDIFWTTGTSVLGVLLLFFGVFRKLKLAFHIGITLGLTVLLTLAANALIRGKLGVMGAAFPCILLGMGVDYGIHLFSTFHAFRENVKIKAERALAWTFKRCGPSILAASATTMMAFFGIATTDFKGLAELGLLSGIGFFVGAVLMLSLFPALLIGSCGEEDKPVAGPIRRTTIIMGRLHRKRHRSVIGVGIGVSTIILSLALIVCAPDPGPDRMMGVKFDSEFSNLRSLRIKAIPLRDRVVERFSQGFADVRVVTEGSTEALAFQAAEEAWARLAPQIKSGELTPGGSILDFISSPAQQTQSLAALRSLDLEACTGAFVKAATAEFGEAAEGAFEPFIEKLREFSGNIKTSNNLSLSDVIKGPLGPLLASFARVDEAGGGRVRLASYIFPAKLDYSEAWYEALATKLESNPPEHTQIRITAARLVGFELKNHLFKDMRWITAIVGILVLITLWVTFRSVKQVALSGVPLIFGVLFVLAGVAVAQMLGWEYSINYVNMIVFPILLGSGIDYGVYMVYDTYSDRKPGIEAVVVETGRGVLLCGLTTLAGFGSMIAGSYTGLISFGWAALWGFSGAMFGGLIVLPSLMSIMQVGQEKPKEKPSASLESVTDG